MSSFVFTIGFTYDKYYFMDRDDIIKELYDQHPIDDIVSFSEIDISDKLALNAKMMVTYTELLNKEKEALERIISLKDKITGEQYDYYRFNYDKELKPSEIGKYYLPKDQKIININKILRRQQWRVDFFAMCVKAIDKAQWNMKNFLESIR